MRLVVPETLQSDVLHHYHTTLEGGHQGVGRTYQLIRDHFHWRGLYRSVQRYVGECVDCETGKGRPVIRGESPGNLQATYPFQIIAMDHIPSLPRSHKENTMIWVDLFTAYVITKASSYRSAKTVAESYEECVFRRFGASEMIRHDREPGFMSDFFRAFNKILGQRQRATMAYRPQANGTAERMVQTATRTLKMFVRDLDQKNWDEYAERLTFAINTAHDRIRGDTPHYLDFPDRPRVELTVDEADRLDFDEFLLPEDSWVLDLGADEYEVERISDVRSGKKTRFGRIYREFLVHWTGYDEPTWVDEADLNCGAILNAFLRERANRNRFNVDAIT
ncbi:reverse transcriptase [Phytophthora megakarya]|uniref:Reverse transcriptase n=1 Tax=Phytophthora megakarya TaxID=4795 RepID=A0A225URT9_9STRA|nr:reverse transcriptase [Phytophthora megakarya]